MELQESEVLKGFLMVPISGKLIIKKSWHQKYCYLFKASKFGIERLEIWDSPDRTKNVPVKIITLENCVKISATSSTHFTITTKTTPFVYEFEALTTDAKVKWISALQSVAFPDDLSLITSVEEDNDLYCSSGEGVFNVRIHPSPASQRCGLDTTTSYILVLTSSAVQLKSTSDGRILYVWPYCYIRRYGYKHGKFTFEAGRKCDSGEGTFFLENSNQQEIFRCLASKMKSMKKLLKEDANLSSILDCGDNQLHAALSMEARSRSPLPPSPTTSTSLQDSDLSTNSIGLMGISESIDSLGKHKMPKQKPLKPPRKSLGKLQHSNLKLNMSLSSLSSNGYEPLDKYDQVEYRSDAWRTMGVNEVKHTENVSAVNEDEEYMSWGARKLPSPGGKLHQKTAAAVITQVSQDDSYDQLNFFGSSSKLNVKSDYKQVAVPSNFAMPSPPSFNDYDEVQPAFEGIRLADDSHLGYALIKKEPAKDKKDVLINHHFHNNEPYAVISKQKKV